MNSVGSIESLYQQYKDIAEFRLIYINEAHAADGRRPVSYAKKMGITEHTNYLQRCSTAQRLFQDKKLTLPCLIDGMDNRVNQAYRAWPDRVFLVQPDGRLAVAADRGPRGFQPALEATETWLKAYRTANAPAEQQEATKDSAPESAPPSNQDQAPKKTPPKQP